jgi:hypothetical protein
MVSNSQQWELCFIPQIGPAPQHFLLCYGWSGAGANHKVRINMTVG